MTIFVKDGVRARDIAVPTFAVAEGGTAATDAATARANLGAVEGVQGQRNSGALTPALPKINFIEGAGATITVVQNVDTIDVTITAIASGVATMNFTNGSFGLPAGAALGQMDLPTGFTPILGIFSIEWIFFESSVGFAVGTALGAQGVATDSLGVLQGQVGRGNVNPTVTQFDATRIRVASSILNGRAHFIGIGYT